MHTTVKNVTTTYPMQRAQRGFTLLELLITLAIAAILMAIAAPSFQRQVQDNRMEALRRALVTSIKHARDDAITNKRQVSICSSLDQVACGGDWSDGWILFSDENASGSLDGGEELIEVYYGDARVDNMAGAGIAFFSFLASGMKSVAGSQFVGFCDPRGEIDGKSLRITTTGSVSFQGAGSAGC